MVEESARRFEVRVTPEMIRHSRINDTLYFFGTFYSIAVLLLVLAAGWSARLRDVAARAVRPRFLVAMLYFALLSIVTTLLEFPLSFYGGFVVPHQFDLTNQSFAAWLGDFAKGIAVDAVIGSLLAALVVICIHTFRRWWLAMWLATIPLIFLGVLATPLIIDPLFNDYYPLRDASLRQALLDEASRAGIERSRVFEVDRSKQTKTLNAYVTGIGLSTRVVLYDTLLQKLDREQILAVMAHEIGHYVLHHVWKGTAFSLLITFAGFFLAQPLFERGAARWGRRWRLNDDRADPAALPWLLAISSALAFLFSPIYSGFSRHIEHQADVYGLELMHLNEADASAFVVFAETSKSDPDPPRFIEWWCYSHPSTARRIKFALSYRPSEKGGQTLLDMSRSRSTSSSQSATANFASTVGSNANPSDSDFLSHARTTVSSPALTETVRGESSMKETSPRTSPGPTVATTTSRPSRFATMSR
jgi:Zn-dependent protease with chaperone function